MTSKSVSLFLVDGTPGGLITAEIGLWTGHIVAAPRTELPALLARPETERTGIYILVGEDPAVPGGEKVYIGEGDEVRKRLRKHARPELQGGKDFWTRAIVLTSKDTTLTNAHARYLESRFVTLAKAAHRAALTNGNHPQEVALPESALADMESFIEQAQIVLPLLGVNIFRTPPPRPATVVINPPPLSDSRQAVLSAVTSPIFELRVPTHHIVCRAQEVDGEFTVLEGSIARQGWHAGDYNAGYKQQKLHLEADGTLTPLGDGTVRFAHDHVFASPSAAAAVIVGHAANGRKKWRISGTKVTFGEWQSQDLSVED